MLEFFPLTPCLVQSPSYDGKREKPEVLGHIQPWRRQIARTPLPSSVNNNVGNPTSIAQTAATKSSVGTIDHGSTPTAEYIVI